jgi:hypothetical protein
MTFIVWHARSNYDRLDLQTVPDLRAAARQAADEEAPAVLSAGFPKHRLHHIVCIAVLIGQRNCASAYFAMITAIAETAFSSKATTTNEASRAAGRRYPSFHRSSKPGGTCYE